MEEVAFFTREEQNNLRGQKYPYSFPNKCRNYKISVIIDI